MKIKTVTINNRKKCFEVLTERGLFLYPFSRLCLKPDACNNILKVFVDTECANEVFTYVLESGKEGSVPLDQVLEYNRDPEYLRKSLLYRLSLKAQGLLKKKGIARREIIRRLGTSPAQFYRLINQTYYNKTIDQMVKLLHALDCEIDFILKDAA